MACDRWLNGRLGPVLGIRIIVSRVSEESGNDGEQAPDTRPPQPAHGPSRLPAGHLGGARRLRHSSSRPGRLRPPTPPHPSPIEHRGLAEEPAAHYDPLADQERTGADDGDQVLPSASARRALDVGAGANAPSRDNDASPILCWSCGRRPAEPNSAARVELRKSLGYRPTIFPLGFSERYLKIVVQVPQCRVCGLTWQSQTLFGGMVGCSGLLVLFLLIVGTVAAGWRILLLVACVIAPIAAVTAILLKLYERRHQQKGEELRSPHTYPEVLAVKQHYKIK